jgi:RNA polymerase II subunit A small phosphatase-like protein
MFSVPRKSTNPKPDPDDPRILLILDLDETLLWATDRPIDAEPAHRAFDYGIYWRPGLHTFIQRTATLFRLAVWTSSSGDYADLVCEPIFRDVSLEFVWARDRCTRMLDYASEPYHRPEPYYAKRLGKLRKYGYDLQRVLVVDDTPEKHSKNYGNLITVKAFEGDPMDRELAFLAQYLEELAVVSGDVRRPEKRGWRSRFVSAHEPQEPEHGA